MRRRRRAAYLAALATGFAPEVWAQAEATVGHAGALSLAPAAVAIAAALVLRTVLPALFLGVWLGAWLIAGFDLPGLGKGLLDAFQVYALEAVADSDHVAVMLFSFMIGGLIGIISNNGGTQGIVDSIVQWIDSRRRGQLATILLGLILFVDDYANTLVVGNTMRPITDRLKISREKLAYLVDSTAAPVAAIAVITTWVGYQVGLIGDALQSAAIVDKQPYAVFLQSIGYSFYPWLCIFLLVIVGWTGRDIGPMVKAERRCVAEPVRARPDDGPNRQGKAANAIVPILALIVGIAMGLAATGKGGSIREVVGSANAYAALMWASLVAVLVAIAMSLLRRDGTLSEIVEHWSEGAKSLLVPMTIVVLAWSLAAVSNELGTADFLVSIIGDSLSVTLLPAVVFGTAALISFATGSSWGTMAIIVPLTVPLALGLSLDGGSNFDHILPASIAAVLAGAVFGDHCSPISDTTIMSSMASGCNHIDHVRTQLPYALLAGGVALLAGYLPSGLGIPWWLSLLLGLLALLLIMMLFGRHSVSSVEKDSSLADAAQAAEEVVLAARKP